MSDVTKHAVRTTTSEKGITVSSGAAQVELTAYDGERKIEFVLSEEAAMGLANDLFERVALMADARGELAPTPT